MNFIEMMNFIKVIEFFQDNEFHPSDEYYQGDNSYFDVQEGDELIQMSAFIKVTDFMVVMHSFKLIIFICVEILSRLCISSV